MPFVKWDFAAWKSDTRRWRFNQRGVYFHLLQEMYISEGRFCLDDLTWFRKEVDLDPRTVDRTIEWLIEQDVIWTDQEGVFHQKRADGEMAKLAKGRVRLQGSIENPAKPGDGLQLQTDENNDLVPPIDREIDRGSTKRKKSPKNSPKKAHPWELEKVPDDWLPEMQKRFPQLDINLEAEKFVNYWTSKGANKKDWAATWRNWCINAEGYRRERNPGTTGGPNYTGAAI